MNFEVPYFAAYKRSNIRHNNTMVKGTQATVFDSSNFEMAIVKLRGLSQESKTAIASVIDRLVEVEGRWLRPFTNSIILTHY